MAAVQQSDAERFLERPDLPADGAGRDVQFVGGDGVGMVAAQFLSKRGGVVRTLRIGLGISLVSALAALMVAAGSQPTLLQLLLPQLPLAFGAGLVIPSAIAGAVTPQGQRAGLAAGLLGCLQMFGAALFGYVAVRLYAGTAVPMLAIQVGAFALAAAVMLLIHRQSPDATAARQSV
ncbi:MAG TPA: hypothetical protein VJ673_18880 [Aromatoleum sp.]|uniref:hypothetical protein n=1 Tax=Aromatoleum sp. TaxID=2307007 RepID=UPI002B4741EA|nr:hypothetical protein [Aromatoleum sp.]HJV27753.1 hypothetical protein [Aromatoleum sp.]